MWESIIALGFSNLRCECRENVVGNVEDELDSNTLLDAFTPIPVDVALLLVQFLCLAAHVEASDVVIIVRRGEGLKVGEVSFHHLDLLFCWLSFALVDNSCFVDSLALLEVGIRFELFEHVEDGVLARTADCFLGEF